MNKRLWLSLFTVLLALATIRSVNGLEINRQDTLKKYYLAQFTDLENRANSSYGKLSPLRVRTVLEHYLVPELCPQCKALGSEQKSVQYHTDVWQDTQVFQTPGKAHIYDAAFPGTTTLGEFYGAYLLIYGATWSHSKISHRKHLLRTLKDSSLRHHLKESLQTLDQQLGVGLTLFATEHSFHHFLDMSSSMDESIPIDLLENHNFLGIEQPCYGLNELTAYENITNPSSCAVLRFNYNGYYSATFQSMAYLDPFLKLGSIYLNHRFKKRSRELDYHPEDSKLHEIVNWMIFLARADGWADLVSAPLHIALSLQRTYIHHWDKKSLNEDMTRKLLELKPFLEALLYFRKISDIPYINFSLNASEEKLVMELINYMDKLSTDGHLYQANLTRIVASVRRILALQKTMIRLLASVAKLDFYLSVAEGIGNHRRWSFVEFDKNDYGRLQEGPGITARRLWNPLLPARQAVASDLTLGDPAQRNIILSGANASGKSTFLRSVGINTIFFAQTLGIAAAQKFSFRPFSHFDSLIDKRDQKGQSSFEGEKALVEDVWKYNYYLKEQPSDSQRVLVIADELFRTTNPRKGAAASKALVKQLGTWPHTTVIISTHFDRLPELGEEYPELFANKHMEADYDEEAGGITTMRFQLTDGICPHTNAMQMFEEELEQNYPELFE